MTVQLLGTSKIVEYLKKLSLDEQFCYGLLIGQSSKEKHYVVHTAKTKPEPSTDGDVDQKTTDQGDQIQEKLILDHFISVSGMIPGGINILGMFIVSNSNNLSSVLRKTTQSVYDVLHKKTNFDGNFLDQHIFDTILAKQTDFFVLNYCTTNHEIVVENIRNGGKDAWDEVKWSIDDNRQWTEVDTNINFDSCFGCPLVDYKSNGYSFKAEYVFNNTLNELKTILGSSKLKFSRHFWEKSSNTKGEDEETNAVKSSIFFQPAKAINRKPTSNTIYLGVLSSKVWFAKDCPLLTVKQYIIDDLIRTISRRFDFYTNSLNCTESTDLETNTQELDLPRRIFIDIPGAGVKFSDLVFHNDDIDDILIEQADQLLDVKLTRENFLTNEYKDLAILGSKDVLNDSQTDKTKLIYIVAAVFIFLAIFIAFILQRRQQN